MTCGLSTRSSKCLSKWQASAGQRAAASLALRPFSAGVLRGRWCCLAGESSCPLRLSSLLSATKRPASDACCTASWWLLQVTVFFGLGRFSKGREPELSDTWKFNVSSALFTTAATQDATEVPEATSSAWSRVSASSDHTPSGRAGHSLTSAEDGKVYLFGGGRFDWGQITDLLEPLLFNTMIPVDDCSWVFDPTTDAWSELALSGGNSPVPRAFAGFTSIGLSLYLFGGLGKEKKKLNDLWAFDIQLDSWTQLHMATTLSPRFGISLVADQSGNLIILGGGSAASASLDLFNVPIPKTVSPPDNALEWLDIYDQDTIDFTGKQQDLSRNGMAQNVRLCEGEFPCSIRIQGDASQMPEFDFVFHCAAENECTDIHVQGLTVACHHTRLQPIFNLRGSRLQVADSRFLGCVLGTGSHANILGDGGSIVRAVAGSNVSVRTSLFHNCSSHGHGGALALFGSMLHVSGSTFVRCSSLMGSGAGIWSGAFVAWPSLPITSEVRVSSSSFTACSAHENGGAMFAASTTLTITESRFSRNVADSGGAMAISAESSASIQSSTFGGNSAKGLGGAALRLSSSNVELLANSFTDNVAENGGGGAILWDGEEAPIVRMSCAKGWYPAPQAEPDGRSSCVPCSPGSYKDNIVATECTACDVGKYSATTGQSACNLCEPGTFQNMTASTQCVVCIANNSHSASGSSRCVCNAGFYGDGVSSCVECIANSHSASGSLRCVCNNGFYGNGVTSCAPFNFTVGIDDADRLQWMVIASEDDTACASANKFLNTYRFETNLSYSVIAGYDNFYPEENSFSYSVIAGDDNCLSPWEFEKWKHGVLCGQDRRQAECRLCSCQNLECRDLPDVAGQCNSQDCEWNPDAAIDPSNQGGHSGPYPYCHARPSGCSLHAVPFVSMHMCLQILTHMPSLLAACPLPPACCQPCTCSLIHVHVYQYITNAYTRARCTYAFRAMLLRWLVYII